MRSTQWRGAVRGGLIALVLVCLSGAALADSDCWCAQFVDLREEIPTRGSSVFLSIAASTALTGAALWGINAYNPPNAQGYRMGALLIGGSNIASALSNLLLPTERSIERAEDRIAESVLDEDLCADTLRGYSSRVGIQRFVSGGIDVVSGLGQILLLSPYGTYATGDFYDYVFLVTGGIDIVGGLIGILFSTRFERDVREARRTCGW